MWITVKQETIYVQGATIDAIKATADTTSVAHNQRPISQPVGNFEVELHCKTVPLIVRLHGGGSPKFWQCGEAQLQESVVFLPTTTATFALSERTSFKLVKNSRTICVAMSFLMLQLVDQFSFSHQKTGMSRLTARTVTARTRSNTDPTRLVELKRRICPRSPLIRIKNYNNCNFQG